MYVSIFHLFLLYVVFLLLLLQSYLRAALVFWSVETSRLLPVWLSVCIGTSEHLGFSISESADFIKAI